MCFLKNQKCFLLSPLLISSHAPPLLSVLHFTALPCPFCAFGLVVMCWFATKNADEKAKYTRFTSHNHSFFDLSFFLCFHFCFFVFLFFLFFRFFVFTFLILYVCTFTFFRFYVLSLKCSRYRATSKNPNQPSTLCRRLARCLPSVGFATKKNRPKIVRFVVLIFARLTLVVLLLCCIVLFCPNTNKKSTVEK